MNAPSPDTVLQKIVESGIVPVFYHDDPEVCKAVAKACYDGGIRVFEFTNRGSRAQENFISLKKYITRYLPEMYLGIGTVKDVPTAEIYLGYNADFMVCPIIEAAIGALCMEKKALWIPGCMTPTEISTAEKAGAQLVELYPCELLGAGFAKIIRPLFPQLRFMPSGEVEPTSSGIAQWMEAGVEAVGMGSKLISGDIIATRRYSLLKDKVIQCRNFIDHHRHTPE